MYLHYKRGKKEKRTTILRPVGESPSEPPGTKPLGWVRKAAPSFRPSWNAPFSGEPLRSPPAKACLESCKYMMFGENYFAMSPS